MATFKINKNLSKYPLIWGLKLPIFGMFIGVVAITATTLIAGISLLKIFIAALVIAFTYVVCIVLSRTNVYGIIFSEKFPDSVKNNLNG